MVLFYPNASNLGVSPPLPKIPWSDLSTRDSAYISILHAARLGQLQRKHSSRVGEHSGEGSSPVSARVTRFSRALRLPCMNFWKKNSLPRTRTPRVWFPLILESCWKRALRSEVPSENKNLVPYGGMVLKSETPSRSKAAILWIWPHKLKALLIGPLPLGFYVLKSIYLQRRAVSPAARLTMG